MSLGRINVKVKSQEAPAPKHQQGSGLPKGLRGVHNGGAGQDQSLDAKATHVDGTLVGRPQEYSRADATRPGKQHGELPGSMQNEPPPLVDPRCMMLLDFVIGSQWGESLS